MKTKKITAELLNIRDNFDFDGVPLLPEEVVALEHRFELGFADQPEQYFTRSLNKLRLRGPNYWQTKCHMFDDIDPECFGCDEENLQHTGPAASSDTTTRKQTNSMPNPIKGPYCPGTTQEVHCTKTSYRVPSQIPVSTAMGKGIT